jgi:hypothetical protein
VNLEGSCITGDPERYVKNSGDGHLSPWGPCWGTWNGTHLPGQYCDCDRKFAVGVRTKSNFWIGDWVGFRAGLQQGLEESQPVLGIELHSCLLC